MNPQNVLAQSYPELVAGCATDCYFDNGIMHIEVKAALTNIAHAAAEDAHFPRKDPCASQGSQTTIVFFTSKIQANRW